MYGGLSKNLTEAYLKQEFESGDALSDFLVNVTNTMDGFIENVLVRPPGNISNPNMMLSFISNLLQTTGLTPLLPLFLNDAPGNDSTVLDIALKLCRLNQTDLTLNETYPAPDELNQLILKFLSLGDDLNLPLSYIMGYSLLNYSDNFNLDDVALLIKALQSSNQTSAGLVHSILSSVELLKTVMDSPDGDPTNIILGYLRQLQEFLKSLFRQQNPSENLNITQVSMLSNNFIMVLTPESLQNLTQARPDAARNIVIQEILALLPPDVQHKANGILQNLRLLEDKMAEFGELNWLTGISEMFTLLNQTLDMLLSPINNATCQPAANNSVLEQPEFEEITSMFFSFFLSPNDTNNGKTISQVLDFLQMIIATPNVSVVDIQDALQHSNLTIDELKNITALAEAVDISDLFEKIMEVVSSRQCFEQREPMETCVVELIKGIHSFLMHLPDLRNDSDVLNHIPAIINNTINFGGSPNKNPINALCMTLANINRSLQMSHRNTLEIRNEIKMVLELIQLLGNGFNTTLTTDPNNAEKVYLEIVEWYLKRLENITSSSSVSALLNPFFSLTQMQLTLQLASTNFSSFISKQVEDLIKSLQYPIDGKGVLKIGDFVVRIVENLSELINSDMEVVNTYLGSKPFNTTILKAAEDQVEQHVQLMKKWLEQPNVSLALTSLLQGGNSSSNVSTQVTDIQQLLKTGIFFLSEDQLAYLSIIDNITQSLSKALMLAEQSGLQSEEFLEAVLEAVQSVMQIATGASDPLPVSTQEDILDLAQDLLKLIVQPGESSPCNVSLLILTAAKSIIQQAVPDVYSKYLLYGIKLAMAYFESISTSGEPDNWNQL